MKAGMTSTPEKIGRDWDRGRPARPGRRGQFRCGRAARFFAAVISLSWAPLTNAQISVGMPMGANIPPASSAPTVRGEKLVPAAMGIRTDKKGGSWNVEQNGTLGRVGNSMVNSGLNLLINNQQFYTYQPMMTADGKEFVLHNRQNTSFIGLQVMRRIRFLENEGAMRYLEILTNTASNPLNLSVSLQNNFSGNYKTYLSDQGNSGVVMLGPRGSAIVVTPGSSQSNRAFVFTLCSAKSGLKPTISSQNKYGLTFQYNLTIPPGQTVVLAHAVAQAPEPQNFERQALARLFKPFALERLRNTIAVEFRSLLANFHQPGGPSGEALLASTSVDGLGVERQRRDVLALGEKTRLIGTASCGELKLSAAYGDAALPFEKVAAIVGGDRGRRDFARVFLRDGQVFTGQLDASGLRFVMASGGKMNLEVGSLDRLVRATTEQDGQWGEGVTAVLETFGGDRLAVESGESLTLAGMTPWGRLEFTLGDLLWFAPMEDEPVGHYAKLKDGTRCFLFLSGESLQFTSGVFGACRLELSRLRAAVTRSAVERAESGAGDIGLPSGPAGDPETVVLQPYLETAGSQRLVGPFVDESLRVLTNSETVEVAPQEVRRMVNLAVESGVDAHDYNGPPFRLELWGGGVIAGYLGNHDIGIRVRGQEWRVPVADIHELVTPVPRLGEKAQQDIARFIRELGSDDWRTREQATEDLREFGYLARSILQEELRINPDPEVQRRLERILSGMR